MAKKALDEAIAIHTKALATISSDPGLAFLECINARESYEHARARMYSEIEAVFPALHEGNEKQRQVCVSLENLLFDFNMTNANRTPSIMQLVDASFRMHKAGQADLSRVVLDGVPQSARCELHWNHAHLVALARHLEINREALADTKNIRDSILM